MLDFMVWLQEFRNPILDFIVEAITITAEETVILAVICLLYWCINKKIGYITGLAVVLGSCVNSTLKNIFQVERPWVLDDRIIPIRKETATGYSFPSGHTQSGSSLWFSIALCLKKKTFYIIAVVIMVLIAISRVYLSVHTPLDVITSLVLAVAIAYISYYMVGKLLAGKMHWSFGVMGASLIIMSLLTPSETTFKMAGVTISFLPSYLIENKYIRFNVKAKLLKQIIKILIGFVIALGIRLGLGALFPENIFFDFIRYFLMGMGILVLAPWVFVKTNLSSKLPEKNEQ